VPDTDLTQTLAERYETASTIKVGTGLCDHSVCKP